jgi:large subunit ribosomal protein L6
MKYPDSVSIEQTCNQLLIKGKHGEITMDLLPDVELEIKADENNLTVSPAVKTGSTGKAMAGTTIALINSCIIGVSELHKRELKIIGVGYRANIKGKKLELKLGFSHPVELDIPEGLNVICASQTEIAVSGIDKQKVGQYAANIRSLRPPEPYKGKGVRYKGENVRRKEAKKQ